MACQTSLLLLNKINVLSLALIYRRKKRMKQQRKRRGSDWSHLNLRRQNFDFHICNTVVAVALLLLFLLLLLLLLQ